jgi:hypothetical protein
MLPMPDIMAEIDKAIPATAINAASQYFQRPGSWSELGKPDKAHLPQRFGYPKMWKSFDSNHNLFCPPEYITTNLDPILVI